MGGWYLTHMWKAPAWLHHCTKRGVWAHKTSPFYWSAFSKPGKGVLMYNLCVLGCRFCIFLQFWLLILELILFLLIDTIEILSTWHLTTITQLIKKVVMYDASWGILCIYIHLTQPDSMARGCPVPPSSMKVR